MPPRNVVVAQSGGPSPVINSSLQGVVDACRSYPDSMGRLYAGWHGIEGVLNEELLDLSLQAPEEISLLRSTPAAGAIGTCRYKLTADQTEDFERIIDVFRAHDIGYFFYIGGNDSMDTANKVSQLAHERGLDLVVTGVPKTIDNDVGDSAFKLIDHTPGYGSAARYWAYIMQNVNEENRGMAPSECVSVLQAMGRTSGFIPAASRLADPQREMPLQIYTAEGGHTLTSLTDHVSDQLRQTGRCMVVVSEGFDVGELGEARDGFGHIEYGASQMAAAQIVANHLNAQGLPARGQATWQMPGVLQRNTSSFASQVDLDEAYAVGHKAVEIACVEGTGWMATILREPGATYRARYDKVPLGAVANSVRHLPEHWLTPDRLDVTDAFVEYARPLIGDAWPAIRLENGLQRFARLQPLFAEKRCADYTPEVLRAARSGA
ncbi:MAG: diphosphate--fructose-6-phosphate 1-phosphotransferase [Verrucomicrobia bacterium]|nr:diphosphate--fructose-6-phosphate 1-phosphotransferase [Verrucomicrobiota bacterium]